MKPRTALFLISSWLLAVALVGANLGAQVPTGVSSGDDGGAPVTLPRSRQYDITSRINGHTYRIFVSTPVNTEPTVAYPVMYVLDGNLNILDVAHAVTYQSFLERRSV